MFNFLPRPGKKLLVNEKGTSVTELALAAPIFALMLAGVADLGMGYSRRFTLQQAANRSLELAQLGTTTGNYNHLIAEAATAAGVEPSKVTLESWLECNGGSAQAFNGTCPSGQQIGRYLRITVNGTYTPLFGKASFWGNISGAVPMSANASLRVE